MEETRKNKKEKRKDRKTRRTEAKRQQPSLRMASIGVLRSVEGHVGLYSPAAGLYTKGHVYERDFYLVQLQGQFSIKLNAILLPLP